MMIIKSYNFYLSSDVERGVNQNWYLHNGRVVNNNTTIIASLLR